MSEINYLAAGFLFGLGVAAVIAYLVVRHFNNNPPNFFR